MPDPQKDIAPIIEPVAPPMPEASPNHVLPPLIGLGCLLLIAILAWHWRKRAPLRSLRRLMREPDPVDAAHALAVLIRKQRISPPAAWQTELERLRFGPSFDGAADSLTRLCRQAETFLKAR